MKRFTNWDYIFKGVEMKKGVGNEPVIENELPFQIENKLWK